MKKRLTWLAMVVVVVIGVGLMKNLVAKNVIAGGVKAMTGLGLDI